MKELTNKEKKNLQSRKEGFEKFLSERMPVLTEFFTDLGFNNAHYVLIEPEHFLSGLDQYMANQIIDSEIKNWIHARIGYYLGEYFVKKYNGQWLVNEDPNSPSFGRYVIGNFDKSINKNFTIDTFEITEAYLKKGPPRSLKDFIERVSENTSLSS